MIKKPYLIMCFLLIAAQSIAQQDVRQAIIAFTDSTELMIRNGRKLVVEKTTTGRFDEALQTLHFLKKNIDKSYVVFFPMEELLIALATSNFQLFLYTAANFHTLLEEKTNAIQTESIVPPLQQFIANELPLIKKDLQRAALSSEQKEFIQLYISWFEGTDKLALHKAIKKYQKQYVNTDYDAFIADLKHYSTVGFTNILLGYGHEFLNGSATNQLSSHFQIMNLEVDWRVNRFYLSLFLNGSVSKITAKQNLPVKNTELTLLAGNEAFSLKYGAKMGHVWVSTPRLNWFTYVSFGGYQFNADQANFEDDDSTTKFKLSNSFFTGLGTSCDIAFVTFRHAETRQATGSVFMRPSLGYDFLLSNNPIGKGGSFYLLMSLGVSFGG